MHGRIDKKLAQAQLAQMINEKPQIIQEFESEKAIPNQQIITYSAKPSNIATLSSVYHKRPETFVTHVRTISRTEDVFLAVEFPTVHVVEPSPIIITPSSITAPMPDLLDLCLSGEDNSVIVPIDQPASPTWLDTLTMKRVGC
nr:multiprotein-bridging factor 1a [Tanacetum cinerariifolium]